MKKYRFLLLDAGPIIKLFELGLWDTFVAKCDITICRTVADEAKWASQDYEDICIDLEVEEAKGHIRIVDVKVSTVKAFYENFDRSYQAILHDGEKETLAFLCDSTENWLVCAGDKAVFKTLGAMGMSERGVSLEKVLADIGLGRQVDWSYTEKFRLQHTRQGQTDSIVGRGLL